MKEITRNIKEKKGKKKIFKSYLALSGPKKHMEIDDRVHIPGWAAFQGKQNLDISMSRPQKKKCFWC